MAECVDHLAFIGQTCPDCNLAVDEYGNTEAVFAYCSFPDCGCDGSRLCMAESGASENAVRGNVEGMWRNGRDMKARKAVFFTMDLCRQRHKEESK